MSAPPRDLDEPAPTAPAPAVIHLPYVPPPAPEKKKPRRQRARHVFVRLDDAELAELQTRARAAGLSAGAYFRQAALGDPGPRSKRAAPTEQSRLKADHVVAINRWGNLANQGIRSLNEIALKAPEATSRDRLADEVMDARELLRGAVAALIEALAMVRGEPD
jgi:hypothetical protein